MTFVLAMQRIKGTGYREADLRLCFRICQKVDFLMTRLFYYFNDNSWVGCSIRLRLVNVFLNCLA